ncbi:MAG: class I SAM-dependent methyltransferase [Acidobacteria bacterium]|nr:class I SAM-dependent methyltransferase [Acidobacteriota bacterium]
MSFKDHFSHDPSDYRRHRPGYPVELFAWLAELAPGRDAAWDCATGTGQAAASLADLFGRVWASDASLAQAAQGWPDGGVRFLVAGAEAAPFASASVDLVTVAQAYHWFDHESFLVEARRVLRPGGVLAVWTYRLLRLGGEIDHRLETFYRDEVGSFWPPERRWVDSGYAELPFLPTEIEPPPFAMEASWRLSDLVGYLGTWSAVAGARQKGVDPLPALVRDLEAMWGDREERRVRWPLVLRVARANG